MSQRALGMRAPTAVIVALLLALGLTGCAMAVPSGAGSTGQSTAESASPDPNDVPVDDTDYSQDAGNEMPDYEYEDEPAPPPSVVGLLCNLNREFFQGLRTVQDGVPVADDALRTNLVGLSDLLSETDSLRIHYPDSVDSIDLGQKIHDKWESALLSSENGDDGAARSAMTEAEELLNKLPSRSQVNCQS